MKPPVLLVAPVAVARRITEALGDAFSVTSVDDPVRARALDATGFHLLTLAAGALVGVVEDAVAIEPEADSAVLVQRLRDLLAYQLRAERADPRVVNLSALSYEEFTELARAASTRRYLVGLLDGHRGSVTDAAKAAGMVRESLHRLIRRHHLDADTFRDRHR
jgi:hypothetical protein